MSPVFQRVVLVCELFAGFDFLHLYFWVPLLHHLTVSSSLCHEAIAVTFQGNLNDDTGLVLQALTVCEFWEDPIYTVYGPALQVNDEPCRASITCQLRWNRSTHFWKDKTWDTFLKMSCFFLTTVQGHTEIGCKAHHHIFYRSISCSSVWSTLSASRSVVKLPWPEEGVSPDRWTQLLDELRGSG